MLFETFNSEDSVQFRRFNSEEEICWKVEEICWKSWKYHTLYDENAKRHDKLH